MEVRRVRALHVDSIVTTRPFPSPQITFYRLRKRASVIRMILVVDHDHDDEDPMLYDL